MSLLQLASLLIVLAGAFGAVNYFFLRLPAPIGILVVALLTSLVMMAGDAFLGLHIGDMVEAAVEDIDFSDALMEGALGLMLFAGALHVKVSDLRSVWPMVLIMATAGVVLSTLVVGYGFHWLTGAPILVALTFGALISPTDPVAVLGVLRGADLRKSLETIISGESLFNDGVGYVVFLVLSGVAFSAGHGEGATLADAGKLFLHEAVGGALLGIALGWALFRLMRLIDDPSLEVLLTLGLAFGGYELALMLHVSGPIMAVCAGLLIGDVGARYGMSEETRKYVDAFWMLVDEILNAVLFLMIGFEIFAITLDAGILTVAAASVALALLGRLIAVVVPVLALKPFTSFGPGVVPIMTWGGLKGGISVALALSLPEMEWKPMILTATYVIVVFSIIVQGLTVGWVAQRTGRQQTLV